MLQPRYTGTSQSIAVVQATYKAIFGDEKIVESRRFEDDFFFYSLIVEVPPTDPPIEDRLELKFRALVVEWLEQRGATSSITEAVMCPAYQGILGMGPAALPLLLAQLKSEGDDPDQWFWALKSIACVDPVADEDRGDFVRMRAAWLQWAEKEGYAG